MSIVVWDTKQLVCGLRVNQRNSAGICLPESSSWNVHDVPVAGFGWVGNRHSPEFIKGRLSQGLTLKNIEITEEDQRNFTALIITIPGDCYIWKMRINKTGGLLSSLLPVDGSLAIGREKVFATASLAVKQDAVRAFKLAGKHAEFPLEKMSVWDIECPTFLKTTVLSRS